MRDAKYRLKAAVGERSPNGTTDMEQVRDLLNRIPPAQGGPVKPLPEQDRAALMDAIANFQTAHRKQLKLSVADRVVGRGGATLDLLYATAKPVAETISWRIPDACHFKQHDNRWFLVNLNNTSSINYTYWWRGCALTALATAFAAMNIRLADVQRIETRARRKHAASKRHEADPQIREKVADLDFSDFGAVNPLTLDSWMTENNSQGFVTAQSAELHWSQVSGVSPRIRFGEWLQKNDRNFPSPALLRRWLDRGTRVIGNVERGEHFVVLTGYRNEGQFLVYDVAYNPRDRPGGYRGSDSYTGSDLYYSFDEFVLLVTYTFS
jgi:hypothetical protein